MYGRSVNDILADALPSAVSARGQRNLRLENQLKHNRPANLPPDVEVTWLRADTLGLLAPSGASAARLRFDSRSLLREIAQVEGFAAVRHVKVLVRPPRPPARSAPRGARLSPRAGAQLQEFAASLPGDSALRAVLERLSRRAAPGRRPGD